MSRSFFSITSTTIKEVLISYSGVRKFVSNISPKGAFILVEVRVFNFVQRMVRLNEEESLFRVLHRITILYFYDVFQSCILCLLPIFWSCLF